MKLLKEMVLIPVNFMGILVEMLAQFIKTMLMSSEEYEKYNELKFQQEIEDLANSSTLSDEEIETLLQED